MSSSNRVVFPESVDGTISNADPTAWAAIVRELPSSDELRVLADLNPDHATAIEQLISNLARDESTPHRSQLRVATRRFSAQTSRIDGGVSPVVSGLAADHRIGPVVTAHGVPVWIDVFRRVRQLRFLRVPGGAPIISLPLSQVQITPKKPKKAKPSFDYALGAGSVWFAVDLFASAPPGLYCGIRIKRGTIRFSTPPDLTGDDVILSPGTSCDLELELDPPTAAGHARNDLAAAHFGAPKRLAVSIRAAGATITALDDGALTVYGEKHVLKPSGDKARYLPSLHRLAIPMAPVKPALKIAKAVSELFTPKGHAAISAAALALPTAAIDPADLGEASGIGAFLLELDAGLEARWRGQSRLMRLGKAELMLDAERLAVSAAAAQSERQPVRLGLAAATAGMSGSVALVRPNASGVLFLSQGDGDEILAVAADASVRLKKPLDVAGQPVSARMPKAVVLLVADGTSERIVVEGLTDKVGNPARTAFALTNAVVRTSLPFGCLVAGELDGETISSGLALIAFGALGVTPSLPDPYAANFGGGAWRRESSGTLLAVVRFTTDHAKLDFILPPTLQLDREPAPPITVPHPAANAAGIAGEITHAAAAASPSPAFAFERNANVILVDVSTAASRFGVALRPPVIQSGIKGTGAPPLKPAAVRELQLMMDGRLVALLTLPAVQWEPVRNIPGPEPFPDEVRFLNSGYPTVVDIPRVDLVPVTPGAAYDRIVANFAASTPAASAARFTLPFGMVANSRLTNPGPAGRGVRVGEARPVAGDLKGVHQLRIDAVDFALPADETPALPGSTVQLPVAQPATGGGGISILGSSPTFIFNDYLGPGSPSALVPVTRIDLSGYGESLFSHWANPAHDAVEVSKAEFQVINGRAGREIVQVQSFMTPGAVPVVRTITLERKGNAVFTRFDSGWVAVRDGTYHYSAGSSVVTHPGVIQRFTRVTNIRETGNPVTVNGETFVAVYYDCDLVIDGAAAPVPAHRQLGYVKLSTGDLDVATYAALINHAGPMGGPVDVTIRVAGGPQKMRLQRIGIGVADSEFAMAAWGSPIFPGGGDWSVLEVANPADAPAPVTADRGLPLIRQGPAGSPSTAPYRFADPEDLFHAASPQRDYGILHAMGTQRAFFRRPRIDIAAPAKIVSTERPVLADPLLLANSVGPFPRQDDTIPYPSNAYALEVKPDGSYRLDGPPSFPANMPRRTIKSAGTVRSDLDYSGSTVTYTVDTAATPAWTFKVDQATKIMANTSLGDVLTMVSDIAAQAGQQTAFNDPTLKLGGAFDIVQDLLTIMQDLGISAKPAVRMTNEWSLKVALKVPFVDFMGEPFKVIPGEPTPTIIFDDTGVEVEIAIAPTADVVKFEAGGKPMFAIKAIPGLYVVAIIQFDLTLSSKDGTIYAVTIGVGVAYELEAGPFELKGLFAITFFGIFGDSLLGYGVGFLVEVSAEISPIVSIELSLEGKLARLLVHHGAPDETVFQVAKLTFAIEVSIFLVFSISMEVETQKIEIIRGPLLESDCPDAVP